MELLRIAPRVLSFNSSWLLVLPLTSYRDAFDVNAWKLCQPTSGVARRSGFYIPGGCDAPSGAKARRLIFVYASV